MGKKFDFDLENDEFDDVVESKPGKPDQVEKVTEEVTKTEPSEKKKVASEKKEVTDKSLQTAKQGKSRKQGAPKKERGTSGEPNILRGFNLTSEVSDKLDFIVGMERAMRGRAFNMSSYVNSLIESDIDKKMKELGLDKLYAEKNKLSK